MWCCSLDMLHDLPLITPRLSPPAVHMPVPHLAGSRHKGDFGPDPRNPFPEHHGQHLHLCLCGTRDLPHHQRPGPGGHSQRQRGPAEENGGHGALQSDCVAVSQGQPAHTRRLMDTSITPNSPRTGRVWSEVTDRSEEQAWSWSLQDVPSVVLSENTGKTVSLCRPRSSRVCTFLTVVKVAH